MKVLAISHFYVDTNRAGGEVMLHGLLKELAARGHEVTMVATDTDAEDTVIDDVVVMHTKDYKRIARLTNPDVIVTQFQNTVGVKSLARQMGIPCVTILHNNMRATKANAQDNHKDNLLVFNTNWIKEDVVHRCKSIVVHPPVDVEDFRIERPKPEYVTLVHLAEEKGSKIFYELARRMPQYKFLGVKGGYWKDRQIISKLPNVTIIENTPNIRDDVYAKTRALLMPSAYESFGMVAREAMAGGVPVVVSDTPGLRENVGEHGFIIPLEDIDTWERVVDSIMSDDDIYKYSSSDSIIGSRSIDTKKELELFVKSVEELHERK